MKILSYGEILWDVYPDRSCIGGAPLNFAAHCAKHGQETFMLSGVGADELGKEALCRLDDWNISSKYVCVSQEKETGKCLVTLDKNLVPSYSILQDTAYDFISCENVPDCFDVLYFGTLALRSSYNLGSLAKFVQTHHFKKIFVDVNIREPYCSENAVIFSLKNADILKISLEEINKFLNLAGLDSGKDFRISVRSISKLYGNLKLIIVTCGEYGSYAFDCVSNKEYECPCKKVRVASTVGAGDSFSAAFLYQFLKNRDIPFCLKYASEIAGRVVSEYEAVPDYKKDDFEISE